MAEFAMHPWHAVVAVGGVEDVADQLDQLGLDKLTFGRWRSLTVAPVIEP
jgi:hypothetical protein